MKNSDYLIIDFDSTFVKIEVLEEIAKEALENNPNKFEIQKEIEEVTDKGMKGEISFSESLKKRLELFTATKKQIETVAKKTKKEVTNSFLENKPFFEKYSKQIFIISGGFKECIFPISDYFEIPRENVLANEFVFNNQGVVVGIDEDNLASKDQGKVKQIKKLNLQGKIFVIGDGWTDYEIKKEGLADFFLAFTENIFREKVVKVADAEMKNFNEVIKFINNENLS